MTRIVALYVTALIALAQADLNRFVVQRDGKYGYINRAGKIAIKPQFGKALEFSEGMAAVRLGEHEEDKWGCIDRTGKLVIPYQFEFARPFRGGLARVVIKYPAEGYIDKTGKYIWEPTR